MICKRFEGRRHNLRDQGTSDYAGSYFRPTLGPCLPGEWEEWGLEMNESDHYG